MFWNCLKAVDMIISLKFGRTLKLSGPGVLFRIDLLPQWKVVLKTYIKAFDLCLFGRQQYKALYIVVNTFWFEFFIEINIAMLYVYSNNCTCSNSFTWSNQKLEVIQWTLEQHGMEKYIVIYSGSGVLLSNMKY